MRSSSCSFTIAFFQDCVVTVTAGGCAVATVLMTAPDATIAGTLREIAFAGEVGISAWDGLMVARLVARDGEILRRDLKSFLTAAGATLPRLWLN